MALNDLIEQLRARRLSEVSAKKTHRKERPAQKLAEPVQGASDRIRAEVYKRILERYADTVGLMEDKTIPELKALVNPEDEAVVRVKQTIFEGLRGENAGWEYSFERDFPAFLKAALGYCFSLKPVNADLSVSYWLKPSEIVELGAADPFDRAIFLCSLLESAGGNARVRVLELEGSAKHAVVFSQLGDEIVLLDPSCSGEFELGSSEKDVLQKHALEGKKIVKSLYEFNNSEYSDFEE
ncbi:MAG: hypothetical protein QXR53_04060 [Candidatus Norongarragalinales archaeon]